jgi:hypothetical protein
MITQIILRKYFDEQSSVSSTSTLQELSPQLNLEFKMHQESKILFFIAKGVAI